jgi:hypothetical protein
MAGEMYKEDLEEGGDFYDIRKEMEDIGHKAGLVVKVEPFDTYQGPQGNVFKGATKIGVLWFGGYSMVEDPKWTFIPESNIRLTMQLKPAKFQKDKMISYLKGLVTKLPSHKPFEVLKGQKPSHYQTPKLKKEQQKSLLHLVKSKYQIVHSERK